MRIVKLFRKMLSIFDNKKKKHYLVPWGVLPLPARSETGLKLGVAPESFSSLREKRKQERLKQKKLKTLSDEDIGEISKSVKKEITDMKLVSGTRGLNNEELDAYYKKIGVAEVSKERKEEARMLFRNAFNSVRKGG